jgi:hypothetical protein
VNRAVRVRVGLNSVSTQHVSRRHPSAVEPMSAPVLAMLACGVLTATLLLSPVGEAPGDAPSAGAGGRRDRAQLQCDRDRGAPETTVDMSLCRTADKRPRAISEIPTTHGDRLERKPRTERSTI